LDLSLWKYSFNLVTRELDLAKKKKQALDNLFSANRISQSTYDYLETEDHLKSLKDKMTMRTQELEKQVNTLELFLASLEIHHAAGDVDDDTHGKQSNAILLGLEATKQELESIRTASQKAVPEPPKAPLAALEPVEETVTVEETAAVEAAEPLEPTEFEEEETIPAEEPAVYEPVETVEPSQEGTAESAVEEPGESEVSPFVSYSEEPEEEPSAGSETVPEF